MKSNPTARLVSTVRDAVNENIMEQTTLSHSSPSETAAAAAVEPHTVPSSFAIFVSHEGIVGFPGYEINDLISLAKLESETKPTVEVWFYEYCDEEPRPADFPSLSDWLDGTNRHKLMFGPLSAIRIPQLVTDPVLVNRIGELLRTKSGHIKGVPAPYMDWMDKVEEYVHWIEYQLTKFKNLDNETAEDPISTAHMSELSGWDRAGLMIMQAKLIGIVSGALLAIDEFNDRLANATPEVAQEDAAYSDHVYRTLASIQRSLEWAREDTNALTHDGSESVQDDEGQYDVSDCRDQLVTFLLPEVSPKGTTLHVRLKESDKRIRMSLALEEMAKIHGEIVPVRGRLWARAKDVLNEYSRDKDVAKHVKRHLETALLVSAQHLCAAYPGEQRFVVDLTQDECKSVVLEAHPFVGEQVRLTDHWAHIDYYDMSGDFQWGSHEDE